MRNTLLISALALAATTATGFAQTYYHPTRHHREFRAQENYVAPAPTVHMGYNSPGSFWTPGHHVDTDGFVPGDANGS